MLQAFRAGLGVFVKAPLLRILRRCCTVGEVQLLLCGTPTIDVDDWQTSATTRGYHADSKEVRWFWSVVRRMGAEQRARLLHFCTGSTRVPAVGFANLMGFNGAMQRFCIERVDGDHLRLPTAATCFNTLRLPRYTDEAQLEQRLLTAIGEADGFDEAAVH